MTDTPRIDRGAKGLNNVAEAVGNIVYVVTANEGHKVKEQIVFASLFDADAEFNRKRKEYGGANVCLASREVLGHEGRNDMTTIEKVNEVLARLGKMLAEKNESYGDSAAKPLRVFSRSGPEEGLLNRIDDKLSRIANGKEFPGDNDVFDLAGYLVLLVAIRENKRLEGEPKKKLPVVVDCHSCSLYLSDADGNVVCAECRDAPDGEYPGHVPMEENP